MWFSALFSPFKWAEWDVGHIWASAQGNIKQGEAQKDKYWPVIKIHIYAAPIYCAQKKKNQHTGLLAVFNLSRGESLKHA